MEKEKTKDYFNTERSRFEIYIANRKLSLLRAATFFMDRNLNAARTLHQAALDLPSAAPGICTPELWLSALLDSASEPRFGREGKLEPSPAWSLDDANEKPFPGVQTEVEGNAFCTLNIAGPSELPGKLTPPLKASGQTSPVGKLSTAVGL